MHTEANINSINDPSQNYDLQQLTASTSDPDSEDILPKKKNRMYPYTCTICESQFTLRSNLKKHISLIHEGKTYQCPICDLKYTSRYNLRTHMSSIHKGEKPFQCTLCDFACTRQYNLNHHVSRVHKGQKIQAQNDKPKVNFPLKCGFCDYVPTSTADYREHFAMHQ